MNKLWYVPLFLLFSCDSESHKQNSAESTNFTFASLQAQTKEQQSSFIQSVVSNSYVPPVTSINNSVPEAVNLILSEFNNWAAIKCSHSIDESLGSTWAKTKINFIGKIPSGSTVEFLVLINKFNCNVIGMVQKTQIVRVHDNVCSVDDIKLEQPDLIYNPDETGFFSIKIKF